MNCKAIIKYGKNSGKTCGRLSCKIKGHEKYIKGNGKCKIKKKIGKNKNIEWGVYGSGSQECQIRNAETGEYYKYKVGSFDEDLFFKVMISTGEVSSGPLTLFYDSPEHYERHQYLELDGLTKKRWEVKRQCRLDSLSKKSKL